MFDLFFPRHWSTLKKLIWLKAAALSSAVQKTVTGAILSIKDALAMPAIALTVNVDPVQSGSGDPAPDNVRPISGWTEVKLTKCGKNLLDEANATIYPRWFNTSYNTWSYSADSASFAFPVEAGQTYTVSMSNSAATIFRVGYLKDPLPTDTSGYGPQIYEVDRINAVGSKTYAMPSDATYIVIQVGSSKARTSKVMIEVGSTKTDYEAYNGTTYSITFPDAAGTVYGGTLDVTNGVLTVEWDSRDAKSSDGAWQYNSRSSTNQNVSVIWNIDSMAERSHNVRDVICSHLKTLPSGISSVGNVSHGNAISIRSTYKAFLMAFDYALWPNVDWSTGATSSTQARDYVLAYINEQYSNGTPVQIVSKYATPVTYQLTPQEVTLLLGENTLWADTGDLEMTYMADGTADDVQALNILLGGRYVNNGGADEATDHEALNILMGR